MNQNFSELIEYLDEKFTHIDERFARIDQRFVTIDEKLEDLRENKADKSDVNNLLNTIDAYAKKADAYFQEMVMLGS
jgi:hypothetical protein